MNNEYEINFVNKFIVKNKRERILYELSSNKKRKNVIGRFCHDSLVYIDESKIVYKGNTISNSELESLVINYTFDKMCYVIAWNSDIDGRFLEREYAINEVIGNGMASIIVFENVIIIESEQEQGAATKYVLYSK